MFMFRICKTDMKKCIIILVCDVCIVIKSIFAEVVTRVEVRVRKFVCHVISVLHLLIKDSVLGQPLRLLKESVAKLVSNQEETINTKNTITEGDHHG